MKILFAINNEQITSKILEKYKELYGEDLEYKSVYYFKALLAEVKKDKSYDRILIFEDLEPYVNNNIEAIDQYLFNKIDSISDEIDNTEIIFVCQERRTKSDKLLKRFFSLGIYNILLGKDRNVEVICRVIKKPRNKKEAKQYIDYGVEQVYERENTVDEVELQRILLHFKKLGDDTSKYIDSFERVSDQYNNLQMKIICNFLPANVKNYLNKNSNKYRAYLSMDKPKNEEVFVDQLVVKEKEEEEEEQPVINSGKSKKILISGKINTKNNNNSKEDDEDGLPQISNKKTKEPEVKIVEKVVEKIVEKEVPVEKIVERIVEKEVPVPTQVETTTVQQVFEVPTDYSKIVALVGGPKAGTTFIINALAYILSKMGIKTAILDMTKQRSMYYIYTNNSEKLRKQAEDSILKILLDNDTSYGIKINKSLDLFTSIPGSDRKSYNHLKLMDKLKMDYQVVLVDCDFTTPIEYYKLAREIYIIQDMDILTVQEVTAFLRELKSREISLAKLQVVINKFVKSNVTGKKLMEGLAFYYDPQMTFVDELFDPRMNYYTIPFDQNNYAKYINNLYACDMDFGNFTPEFLEMVAIVANVIYPTSNKTIKKQFKKNKLNLFGK